MSTAQTLVLGALAGSTLLLGLPMGRVRTTDTRVRAALSSLACGILVFLLADVLVHAVEPVEEALTNASDGGSWGTFAGLAILLGGGLAAGIGLHNFGEGLTIGQSAAAGETALAVTLIVGFGLHNATESFGIVGPMTGEPDLPSWRFLGLLGLIGGGPTFLGTVVGHAWVSEAVSVAFFAVAAGPVLYVVQELPPVNRRFGHPALVTWLLLFGLLLGYATDFVVELAGG